VAAKAAPAKASHAGVAVEHLTKGYRTRNNKRTQTMIVSRRKK
jgi:ribosomal protein L2